MTNPSETHFKVVFSDGKSEVAIMINKDDEYCKSTLSVLMGLCGNTIESVIVAEPANPLLKLWKDAVSSGETLLSFDNWSKEQ